MYHKLIYTILSIPIMDGLSLDALMCSQAFHILRCSQALQAVFNRNAFANQTWCGDRFCSECSPFLDQDLV